MAAYNLERFTVFLVEDNGYVRQILEDLLHHFEIGRVISCTNGAEAIEYLRTLHSNPQMAGTLGLDIIISDLVMAPINGLLLCRWVRSAKESPNRFIPFIMISGAADNQYVASARDLGATEFIAKPFSAELIYKRLLEVIDYPRQIVATHTYFGPDRRRQDMVMPDTSDRRKTKDDDITVVYAADNVKKPKKEGDVWYFRLPNRLKEKAGGLGAKGPGEMPTALLEQAEQKLERSKLDFTDWALSYLSQLSNLCAEALLKPGRRNDHFTKINLLAHELRGQGGTFGYPLITVIGKMLYDITGEGCREDDSAVEIVKAHIDTMRAVIRDKVAGDGGKLGQELLIALKQAIDKHSVVR